jgi:hypothetical protein
MPHDSEGGSQSAECHSGPMCHCAPGVRVTRRPVTVTATVPTEASESGAPWPGTGDSAWDLHILAWHHDFINYVEKRRNHG